MSSQAPNGSNGKSTAIVSSVDSKRKQLESMILKGEKGFRQLLPAHVKVDVMMRSALAAISRTPELLNCTPSSVVLSLAQACSLGLPPNTPLQLGFLVPYKATCQFIIGYKGLIRLMRQSGEVDSVETDVIRSNDTFSIRRGTDSGLDHSYKVDGDRGDIIGFYSVAHIRGARRPVFEFMTKAEIDRIRDRSKASSNGPWVTDYEQMARKTTLRRLANYMPLSEERFERAIGIDNAAEGEAPDFSDVIDVMGEVVEEPTNPHVEFTGSGSRPVTPTDALRDRVSKTAQES
jgi:recombination protein RecT